MRLVYFASVREAIGFAEEERELPPHIANVRDVLSWLADQSSTHSLAFANRDRLRFALDQNMVTEDAPISNGKELAIFPPVTGG